MTTLWQLTIIKFEFLMQLYLPLILGLYWPRFTRRAAFAGLGVGALSVTAMLLAGWQQVLIFDAGLVGFLLNAVACVGVTLLTRPNVDEQRRVRERFFVFFERASVGRTPVG